MSWEDRDYARDEDPHSRFGRPGGDFGGLRPSLDNPATWSVTIGAIAGIVVRVHALMLLLVVILLLQAALPGSKTALGFGYMAVAMGALFLIVLLHEFGHCFACRMAGGEADEILMWPLGGLAYCRPPHRWRAHLSTAVGGPMVNVILLIVLTPILGVASGRWGSAVPSLFDASRINAFSHSWLLMSLYLANWMSLALLIFNLLPLFPLDGGRIVQCLLWPKMGYSRSMLASVRVGFVGAIALGVFGLVTGHIMLLGIAIFGGFTCFMTARQVKFTDEFMGFDSDGAKWQSVEMEPETPPEPSRRDSRRDRRRRLADEEASRIDAILAKIADSGFDSLSVADRRTLKRATRRKQDER